MNAISRSYFDPETKIRSAQFFKQGVNNAKAFVVTQKVITNAMLPTARPLRRSVHNSKCSIIF